MQILSCIQHLCVALFWQLHERLHKSVMKKKCKNLSSILLVCLAVKRATRGNQVYSSNEVDHCCEISHRTKILSCHLVTPTLTTVSITGVLLFLTAKHAGASKVVDQAPSASDPEHTSRCHL